MVWQWVLVDTCRNCSLHSEDRQSLRCAWVEAWNHIWPGLLQNTCLRVLPLSSPIQSYCSCLLVWQTSILSELHTAFVWNGTKCYSTYSSEGQTAAITTPVSPVSESLHCPPSRPHYCVTISRYSGFPLAVFVTNGENDKTAAHFLCGKQQDEFVFVLLAFCKLSYWWNGYRHVKGATDVTGRC